MTDEPLDPDIYPMTGRRVVWVNNNSPKTNHRHLAFASLGGYARNSRSRRPSRLASSSTKSHPVTSHHRLVLQEVNSTDIRSSRSTTEHAFLFLVTINLFLAPYIRCSLAYSVLPCCIFRFCYHPRHSQENNSTSTTSTITRRSVVKLRLLLLRKWVLLSTTTMTTTKP